ncbi:Hypothetical protein A7982_04583 [Minicystis rosea]|nr:Hypothetical protein A7982_04583 [Minicystis rosea]
MSKPEDHEWPARRGDLLSKAPQERAIEVVAGGSMMDALCGAAAIVLSFMGLAGSPPWRLGAIAAIVLGAALVVQGGSFVAGYRRHLHDAASTESLADAQGGAIAELLGGAASIALGILAFLGFGTELLLPIAVIVLGGSFLLGGAPIRNLSMMGHGPEPHVASPTLMATSGMHALVGIGAGVLGVLALVGLAPVQLTLIALLALGSAVFISGTAVSSRMGALLRH